MRRTTTFLFALAVTFLVPTMAHAGSSPAQDPDGQALKALAPWFDSLLQVLLTQLGI